MRVRFWTRGAIRRSKPRSRWRLAFAAGPPSVQARHQASRRVEIGGRVAFARSDFENDDVHLLRDDLQQDPSFHSEGDGDGLEFEGRLTIRLTPLFGLRIGYRKWELETDGGTDTAFAVGEAPVTGRMDRFKTSREGLIVGLVFRLGREAASTSP